MKPWVPCHQPLWPGFDSCPSYHVKRICQSRRNSEGFPCTHDVWGFPPTSVTQHFISIFSSQVSSGLWAAMPQLQFRNPLSLRERQTGSLYFGWGTSVQESSGVCLHCYTWLTPIAIAYRNYTPYLALSFGFTIPWGWSSVFWCHGKHTNRLHTV